MPKNENTKGSFEPLFKKNVSPVGSYHMQPEAKEAINAIRQFEERLNQAKYLLAKGNLSPTCRQKLAENIATKTQELGLAKARFEYKKYVLTL